MLPDTTAGHDVSVERLRERVLVVVDGEIIADTTAAIRVFETGLEPVIYIPKIDIHEIDLIKCGDYECPYKGHAEFYTIRHVAHDIENAAWSYSNPLRSLPELEGRVAFYPHKVQEIKLGGI